MNEPAPPRAPGDGTPRLLILRLSSLGDVLHTLPAVASLRAAFPAARIDWVVEDRWKDLIELNPDVTHVVPVSTKAWRAALDQRGTWREVRSAVAGLRNTHYDAALDFQGLMKSALLARLSGARRRIGFDTDAVKESAASMFYTLHVRPPAGVHVVEMNLALARAAGAENAVMKFPLTTRPEDDAYVEEQLRAHHLNDFFLLSPGGGWGAKRWPLERYVQLHNVLARARGWRSFINAGPGEEPLVQEFMEQARVVQPVHFPLTLRQLVALVKRARLVVTGDTGPLHVAAAVGTPLVALFGPTDPVRNGPYGGRSLVIHHREQAIINYKHEDTPSAAMLAIAVEEVLAATKRVLEEAGG